MPGNGAAELVSGGPDGGLGSSCAGTPRRTSAAFRRWYADPEIARLARYQADADAPRGDRAVLRGAGRRDRTRWRWPSTSAPRTGSIGTCAFSQLDGENGSALYHITIGESDAWGQRLRHRGDPADARPRVRDARAAPDRAVRVRVQRARDPGLPALRVRGRGPVARVDLARRALVGRAGDERPRVGLAARATAGGRGPRRRPTRPTHRATDAEPVGRRTPASTGLGPASSGGGDDDRGRGRRRRARRRPRADRGQGPHRRQRARRGRPARGGVRRRLARSARPRWSSTWRT